DRTMAYLMRAPNAAAIVAINRADTTRTLVIDARGMLPDAVKLVDKLGTLPGKIVANGGTITVELPPLSAAILIPQGKQDLVAPKTVSLVGEGANGEAVLNWNKLKDASRYRVYRSPVTGGGYEYVAEVTGAGHVDTGVEN